MACSQLSDNSHSNVPTKYHGSESIYLTSNLYYNLSPLQVGKDELISALGCFGLLYVTVLIAIGIWVYTLGSSVFRSVSYSESLIKFTLNPEHDDHN